MCRACGHAQNPQELDHHVKEEEERVLPDFAARVSNDRVGGPLVTIDNKR